MTARKGLKVVILDDNKTARDALCLLLNTLGHNVVHQCKNAEELIELFEKSSEEFDLVITDIVMSQGTLDGLDAVQRIHDTRPTPVIICSAFAENHYLDRIKGMGAGYVVKASLTPDQLKVAIETTIDAWQQRRQLQQAIEELERVEDVLVVRDAKQYIQNERGVSMQDAAKILQKGAGNKPLAEHARLVLALAKQASSNQQ